MRGFVYKRCGCTDGRGRRLGAGCARLDDPGHGAWCYVADLSAPDGGRRQRRRGGFATQQDAQAALGELLARSRASGGVDDQLTVGAFFDWWMDDSRHLCATTRRSYTAYVDHFLRPYLGAIPLEGLRAAHITDMYASINAGNDNRRRPVGPTSFARLHATLRAGLNAAVKQQRIAVNPALYVDLPVARPPTVRPWSTDELGLFLDAAGSHRLGVLFEVMALAGLRRGEACSLRWADVDLEGGELTVDPRHIDLDIGTTTALLWYRLEQDDERAEWGERYQNDDLVFCLENGSPLQSAYVTRLLQHIAEQAGLPRRRVHDLQQGSGTLPVADGVPTEIIAKRLRFSPIVSNRDVDAQRPDRAGRRPAEAIAAQIPRHPRQSQDRHLH